MIIILSIPIIHNFPYESIPKLNHNYLELRLDYAIINKLQNKPYPYQGSPFSSYRNHKIILTHREPEEGGLAPIDPFLKECDMSYYSNHEEFISDCELDFYLAHKPNIKVNKLILSKHIQEGATNNVRESVLKTIEQMDQIKAMFYKIVFPINSYADLDFSLNLPQQIGKKPLILQGSGLLGKLFRIMRLLMEHKIHYVGLKNYKTAPEQLTYEDLDIYSRLKINNETYIGGIIGDRRVYGSLGLQHYNKLFAKKNLNAVYLPFPVNDQNDFFGWIERLQKTNKIYGFSVTTPLKKKISSSFINSAKPVNLISVLPPSSKTSNHTGSLNCITKSQLPYNKPNYLLNTDKEAMNKAFEYLKIDAKEKILIFGYGATAETALSSASHLPHVIITGRDNHKGKKLAQKYSRVYLEIPALKGIDFDVIINCSPVGSNNEDLLQVIDKRKINKLIDLPYGENMTPIVEYCLKRNLPHVDGEMFWHWQAETQKKVFLKNIRQ